MKVNKTNSDCTIYAFVGTAILAISLVLAMRVGNDFHQSLFVESITFAGSNVLLWAIFLSMVNCPYELMTVGSSMAKKAIIEVTPETEQKRQNQTMPQVESVEYSHEDYVRCAEAHARKAQEEKEKRAKAILDYAQRTMSRFLYEEDLKVLIGDIQKWMQDNQHKPVAVKRFKESVKGLPLRHFVWNISERLGKREYNTKARIAFLTALFPQHFGHLDYSTLKNLRTSCADDVIPIDDPDGGDYRFHDKVPKESEQS